MTPFRRAKLDVGIHLIDRARDRQSIDQFVWDDTKAALIREGARFVRGDPNQMRFAGISTSCTHCDGKTLMVRWREKAMSLIEGETPMKPT
jgi:hypothetical protein